MFHTVIKRKVYTEEQNYFILTNKLDLCAILQANSYGKNCGATLGEESDRLIVESKILQS